jgi:hypothetical protein
MNLQDAIEKAIAAHGAWKIRLVQAIENCSSEFNPTTVSLDNQCEFGKWLYGEIPPEARKSQHYDKVKTIHADFHKEAGRILNLATQGKKEEAQKAVASGSKYSLLTGNLALALGQWKKEE